MEDEKHKKMLYETERFKQVKIEITQEIHYQYNK